MGTAFWSPLLQAILDIQGWNKLFWRYLSDDFYLWFSIGIWWNLWHYHTYLRLHILKCYISQTHTPLFLLFFLFAKPILLITSRFNCYIAQLTILRVRGIQYDPRHYAMSKTWPDLWDSSHLRNKRHMIPFSAWHHHVVGNECLTQNVAMKSFQERKTYMQQGKTYFILHSTRKDIWNRKEQKGVSETKGKLQIFLEGFLPMRWMRETCCFGMLYAMESWKSSHLLILEFDVVVWLTD